MNSRLVVAVIVLGSVLGCGNESAGPADTPPCSPEPTIAAVTSGDLSALDPARCPAAIAEDLLGAVPHQELHRVASPLAAKAFYVLALLSEPKARAALRTSAELAGVARERFSRIGDALTSCNGEVSCWTTALRWPDEEIETAAASLADLARTAPAIRAAAAALRASGRAQLHAQLADAALLAAAWRDAMHALNLGWDEYVTGLTPAVVESLLHEAAADSEKGPLFASLLNAVLGALDADGRDEAARYEPLADGENAAARARIPCIDFARYPFSVIVVPGQGPNDLEHPLDPTGQTRADQAAARFAAGLAPLIALSGGHVHPDRTPYSEAIEMKRYLMDTYGIPPTAILVDPHARHTTTNLRNVARLMYRYGVPVDRPALITSDQYQTLYISMSGPTQFFGQRCLDELGYLPYRGITRLDFLDDCWVPSVDSLYADARDLLDP